MIPPELEDEMRLSWAATIPRQYAYRANAKWGGYNPEAAIVLPRPPDPVLVGCPGQRIGAGRAEDGATHASARLESGVRGVDDGVSLDGRDVALKNHDETWRFGGHSR